MQFACLPPFFNTKLGAAIFSLAHKKTGHRGRLCEG